MQPNQRHAAWSAAVAVVFLVALVTPWWTAHVSMSSGQFGMGDSGSESAGPFDADGLVDDAKVVVAGLLVLFALLGALASAALHWVQPQRAKVAHGVLAASAGLVLLAAILAPTTWPDGIGFWDSERAGGGGFTANISTYASFGWYAALVGVLVAAFAVVQGLRHDGLVPAPSPAEAPTPVAASAPASGSAPATSVKCAATTKAGTPCARKATSGAYCAVHAP